jgi:hypothetical protein
MTPQQAADAALKAITPSTRVSTDGTAVVAGRSAYELRLEPRDTGSLVGSVRIAIDGKTHVPTRVQVFARGADKPAFEVGFTSFEPSDPPASVFRFNPPPGTTVTESKGLGRGMAQSPSDHGTQPDRTSSAAPRTVGTGWATVVVATLPAGAGAASGSTSATRMLDALPTVHGSWGSGHLLRGSLFSALLTDDGRVAVGAVAPQALYSALSAR